uniref:Transcription elongation factor 1 homolog n=1 Tax=Blastobotrys adeninivorans TaxID=409370 RepID=A0A060TAV8_BLAAD
MGKRKKSSRGPAKKVKQTLDTTFSCLFCNHERSVVCVMDKKAGVGNLSCKVCGQTFQAPINALSDPVDVYSEWVDACEAVASAPAADKESGVNETSEKDFVVDDQDGELSDLDESEFQ